MSNGPAAIPRQYAVKPTQRLSSNGHLASSADDENDPVLAEAKLLEMITSLRQLINSNAQLDEALENEHDEDLLQALEENEGVILRRTNEAAALAAKIASRGGVKITLEDKIPKYEGSEALRKIRAKKESESIKGAGLYL